MDLHVIGPLATPAERAAVDAVLGPATSGWAGGARSPLTEGHVATGGHEARSRRDLLLPALHALQDRVGQITQPGMNYVCRRLSVPPAEAYGVATFYALFSTKPRPPSVAHVCDDIACRLAGRGGPVRRPGADARARGRRGAGRQGRLAAQPVPGHVRAGAGGHVHDRRRDADRGRRSRPSMRPASSRGSSGAAGRVASAPARPEDGGLRDDARASVPQVGEPQLQLLRRVGHRRPDVARRLPRERRLRRARAGAGDGRGGRDPRGHGVEAHGPRRRGLPDRAQVGRGREPSRRSRTTSSATPTSRSRARSRIGCSWSSTRSPSSRR